MLKKKGMIGALTTATAVGLLFAAAPAFAGVDDAKKWVESEFQPSTLSKEEQMKEMEWLVNAAKPFAGMEINVVSETITTHEYESKVLAKAFASTFDSYSWVVMVSETTLISMPAKGFAAFTNHSISFICSSFESVDGWNSDSTHFFASSTPANAGAAANKRPTAVAVVSAPIIPFFLSITSSIEHFQFLLAG